MCNHPRCIFIDILQMTNGEKLYVHYDGDLIPVLLQFWDEGRAFEKDYYPVPLSNIPPDSPPEPDDNIHLILSNNLIIYNGTCEIPKEEIIDLNES